TVGPRTRGRKQALPHGRASDGSKSRARQPAAAGVNSGHIFWLAGRADSCSQIAGRSCGVFRPDPGAVRRRTPSGGSMNRSAKRQHHEKARKEHRRELKQHEREAAKKTRSAIGGWVVAIGIGVAVLFLIGITFAR